MLLIDREAVQQLESKIRSERTSSGERALYHAALLLWLSGRSDKSREYADRLLKVAPGSEVGLPLRGWIDLTSGKDTVVKKSIKYFEEAAAVHSQHRWEIFPIPILPYIHTLKLLFQYLHELKLTFHYSHTLIPIPTFILVSRLHSPMIPCLHMPIPP